MQRGLEIFRKVKGEPKTVVLRGQSTKPKGLQICLGWWLEVSNANIC